MAMTFWQENSLWSGKIRKEYILLLVFVLAFTLVANFLMPLVGEDLLLIPWNYGKAPSDLVERGAAIIRRVGDQSSLWNARIGEALAIVTGAFNKALFNVLNSLVFVLLIVLLFIFGFGRSPEFTNTHDLFGFLVIIGLILTLNPVLGTIFFWKAGSCNHLWGVTILLAFTVPYRLFITGNNSFHLTKVTAFFYFCLGIIAGMTLESVGFVVAGCIIVLAVYWRVIKKRTLPFGFSLGLVALCIGITFLLSAPSTQIRRFYYESNFNPVDLQGFSLYLYRFKSIIKDYLRTTWPLLLLSASLAGIFFVTNRRSFIEFLRTRKTSDPKVKNLFVLLLFLVASLSSVMSLIMIPYFSEEMRGYAFHWLCLYFSIAYLAQQIWTAFPAQAKKLIVLGLILVIGLQSARLIALYHQFYEEVEKRYDSLESQIASGKTKLVLEPLNTKQSWMVETREDWFNKNPMLASYYGVQAILVANRKIDVLNVNPVSSIFVAIEEIDKDDQILTVSGWGSIKSGALNKAEQLVVLRSFRDGSLHFFSVTPLDPSSARAETKKDQPAPTGFTSAIIMDLLEPGEYQVGIAYGGPSPLGYALSERTIAIP